MHLAVLSDPNHFHTQKWVKGLLKAGVKVTVVSFFEGEIPGARCMRIKPQFTLMGRLTYLSYWFGGKALSKVLRQVRPDALNPIHVTPYGVWGERSGFRPLVQLAMGADILEYPPRFSELTISRKRLYASNSLGVSSSLQKLLFPMKWRIFRRNVARALDQSALVLGDNKQLIRALEQWFGVAPERLQLNRWGIEEDFFKKKKGIEAGLKARFGIGAESQVILAPRGLKPVYQGDVILDAFEKILLQGHTNLHLVVLAAGYESPDEVWQKAEALDRQYANFTFVRGLIPREEMGSLWRLVDAFVIAPVYDGYSNALNEGRYVGAIPILNDIPAHREMMEDGINCRMLSPFDAESLAEEIPRLMANSEKWKARFHRQNLEWIREEALFDQNIGRFLKKVEEVT